MSRKFFKNAGLLAATEIILKLKGFVIIPLLTRHFGALNYGAWAQVGVLVSTFAPLIMLGTDSAVLRYLPARPSDEKKRYFFAWIFYLLAVSVPICMALYLFKHEIALLFFGGSGDYERFVPLVSASLLIGVLLNAAKNWYVVHRNAKMIAGVTVSQAVLGLLSVVVVLTRKQGVYDLVVYSLGIDLVITSALFIHIIRTGGWSPPDYSILRMLLRFGFPLVPSAYAMWGLNSMDRLLLVRYASLQDVGVYALIYGLGYMIIQMVVNPVWMMFSASAAELYEKGDRAGLSKLFERSVGLILALAVPAIVGLFVLGERLIDLLATSEFVAAASLMAIITIGYLLHMLASYFDVALGLIQKPYWSTVSIVTAAVVNLVCNFLLIPAYGIRGAALATVLGFLSQFMISFAVAQRLAGLYPIALNFPLRIIAASGLMGIGVHGMTLMLPQGLLFLFVLILAGGVLYGILVVLLRVVSFNQVKLVLSSAEGKPVRRE